MYVYNISNFAHFLSFNFSTSCILPVPDCHGDNSMMSLCTIVPGCHGANIMMSYCTIVPGCHGDTILMSLCTIVGHKQIKSNQIS